MDFWRQCRRSDGSGAVWHFLSHLWVRCRSDSHVDEPRLDRAIGWSVRCAGRRARCLPSAFSNCAPHCLVAHLFLPLLFRNARGLVSWVLVFHPVIQWHARFGWPAASRRHRVVGARRGIRYRNALVLVLCAPAAAIVATGRIRNGVGVGAAPPLRKNRYGFILVIFHAFGPPAGHYSAIARSVPQTAHQNH